MSVLYLCLGILIFITTALDIIKTTLSSSGGGKITDFVSQTVWMAFFSATGKRGRSKVLEYAGPAILVFVLLTWVLGLWTGLFLILLSDPDSVLNSTTLARASALEKLYYAGFTLSTLGVGDYKASNDLWRLVTGASAFSGLAFITASITYFVPVLSAVGLQSKLSLYISGMGKTPQQVLANSWDGKGFAAFFDNTSDICQMLMQHTMNHHSYPVIHYFHNSKPQLAVARAIVLLHESHHLLRHAVSKEVRNSEVKTAMLQTALGSYLEMVEGSFLENKSPKEKAPMPGLEQLAERGIPVIDKEAISLLLSEELHDRRKTLTALLEMDGWSWRDVY